MDALILIAWVLLLIVLLFGVYGVIRAVVDRVLPPRPAEAEPEPETAIDPQVAEWRRRKALRQQLHAELLGPDTQD